MKFKAFSGKVKQNVQKYINQNLVRGRFLENGLRGTINYKPNILSVSKEHYLAVCQFLSEEVKTNILGT